MDEELTNKLSSYNTMDESTGFEYRISVVDAEPSIENAVLQQDRYELTNLRELYDLDSQYEGYDKAGPLTLCPR